MGGGGGVRGGGRRGDKEKGAEENERVRSGCNLATVWVQSG